MPGLATIDKPIVFSTRWSHVLEDSIADLDWPTNGGHLLVGSADGMLHRFDAGGQTVSSWRGHDGGITRVQLQPGSEQVLASAGEDGHVVLWDVESGEQLSLLAEEGSWVEQLIWTPDGKVLAAAASKTISLWKGEESLGIWYDARRQVLAMAWAPDSKRLATASNKGLYLWRLDSAGVETAEPMQLLSFPGAPVAVAWQPSGAALAVGTQDGFLQIWRQSVSKHGPRGNDKAASQLTMRGYPGKVTCLAWHPTRPLIATAGGPDVVMWDLPQTGKGAKGQPLRQHEKTVSALAWSPDGRLLASGDRNGQLCLWDDKGNLIFSQQLDDEISVLAWRPNSDALAIGDTGGCLTLLARDTYEPQHPSTSPDSGGN